MDAIGAEAAMQVHLAFSVVATENAGEAVLERDDCAIEDAISGREKVTWDDGVGAITPDDFV
jgi:hypothetical protein